MKEKPTCTVCGSPHHAGLYQQAIGNWEHYCAEHKPVEVAPEPTKEVSCQVCGTTSEVELFPLDETWMRLCPKHQQRVGYE